MKRVYVFFVLPLLFWGSLCLGGQVISLPEVMKAQRIIVDGAQLFITEGATIYIYSLKDFKLQKKFGKRGEGPGEFKESGEGIKLEIGADTIVVNSTGRLSTFSRQGRFIKETTVSDPRRFNFQALREGRFVGKAIALERGAVFFIISLYDRDLKKIKEIYRYKHPFFPRKKPINAVSVRISTYYVYRDKIFYDDEEGIIYVLNSWGEELYSIDRKIDREKVTDLHKKRYLLFWQTGLKAEYDVFKDRLRFPSLFPPIRNFHLGEDKIYVITHQEQNGKCKMLILDLEGKLLKQLFVPLTDIDMLIPDIYNYYTIHKGKLYILRDNPDTEVWELHIEPIVSRSPYLEPQ